MKHISFLLLFIGFVANAQMHKVTGPDSITRAIGVYEWTGDDITKAKAARLIPVSLFLSGHFEDAATYLSTPIPLAVQTGVAYELQTAGVRRAFLDIAFARNLKPTSVNAATGVAAGTPYDDGWFGYGKYRPLPKPKVLSAKNRRSKEPEFAAHIALDDDDKKKPGDTPDPERPTLQRPTPNTTTGRQKAPKETSGVSQAPPDPDTDPDRPSLKRHTSAPDTGDATTSTEAVTAVKTPILSDPDRPEIHRGRPSGPGTDVAQELKGLPPDLHQSVAVSDANDRPEHDFTHIFAADTDRKQIMAQMEKLAKEVVANPSLALQTANPTATPDRAAAAEPAPVLTPSNVKKGNVHPSLIAPARKVRSGAIKVSEAGTSPALADEQLAAFDLAYNSTPTYIFTAHTDGTGAARMWVTVVAQPDLNGGLQPVLRAFTDEAHLDRVPRLRLIDAVDAEASNRASLLFELRSAHSRQFALYRVVAGHIDQSFLSGTTQ